MDYDRYCGMILPAIGFLRFVGLRAIPFKSVRGREKKFPDPLPVLFQFFLGPPPHLFQLIDVEGGGQLTPLYLNFSPDPPPPILIFPTPRTPCFNFACLPVPPYAFKWNSP